MERVKTACCPLPRGLLLALAIAHSLFAGSFYGFVQLSSALANAGAFASLCGETGAPCDAQASALAEVYTYGSVVAFATPLFSGYISGIVGPRVTLAALAILMASGWGLLLAAVSGSGGAIQSQLLLPAMVLIGASSAANYLPLLSVASLFRRRGLVLSVISGSFDAGSVVFLVIRLCAEAGTPLSALILGALAGPVVAVILCVMFVWRNTPFSDLSDELADVAGVRRTGVSGASPAALAAASPDESAAPAHTEVDAAPPPPPASPLRRADSLTSAAQLALAAAAAGSSSPRPGSDQREASVHGSRVYLSLPTIASPASPSGAVSSAVTHAARSPFLPALNTERLHALPWHTVISRTPEFLGFLMLFIVIAVRFNYFLASIFSQLLASGAGATADSLLSVLGFLMPALALPVVLLSGSLADARGPVVSITVLCVLATLTSALQLVPSLSAQYATFVAFVFMRGFLFSQATVFMSVAFGFNSLGVLVGVTTAVGGCVGLVASSLMSWAAVDARGYTAPNALMLALSGATLLFPAWLAARGGHRSLYAALTARTPSAAELEKGQVHGDA